MSDVHFHFSAGRARAMVRSTLRAPRSTLRRGLPVDGHSRSQRGAWSLERGAVTHEGQLWIPLLYATRPGNGDVGRFLDALPRDRTVIVPEVISPILDGMLRRRGFRTSWRWNEEAEEFVEVWVREGETQ